MEASCGFQSERKGKRWCRCVCALASFCLCVFVILCNTCVVPVALWAGVWWLWVLASNTLTDELNVSSPHYAAVVTVPHDDKGWGEVRWRRSGSSRFIRGKTWLLSETERSAVAGSIIHPTLAAWVSRTALSWYSAIWLPEQRDSRAGCKSLHWQTQRSTSEEQT